jgi:hypothetical protein
MPDQNTIINSFLGGEISPKLYGRTDLPDYKSSVKTLTNMRVRPQGGADRRGGLRFVAETKTSSVKSRLLDFDQKDDQAYILEFGNLYARVFRNDDQVRESAKTITGITAANPPVVTSTAHGYTNGDHVWLDTIVGMTELNKRRVTVANKTTNTFECSGIDASAYTAYGSAGTAEKVYEFVTPYLTADLFALQTTQDQDQMYIAHELYPTKKLTRTAHTAWTIANHDFQDGPYLALNATAITLTPGATSGSTSLTASAPLFAATDTSGTGGTGQYDRLVRWKDGAGAWHWMKITAYTSTTVVTVTIVDTTLSATTGTVSWNLGAFSDTTGYPRAVHIAEQRLVLAATTLEHQTFWYSAAGDYALMSPDDATTDDATAYTVAAKRENAVQWITSLEEDLLSGTTKAEWRRTGAISPSDAAIRPVSYEGSALVQPVETPETIVFVHTTKALIMGLGVTNLAQTTPRYETVDLTFSADHLALGGFIELSYSHHPYRSIIAVCNDGSAVHCTYDKQRGTSAWSKWTTDGSFESAETVQIADTGTQKTDRTWFIVSRTINGATVRYVEYEDPTLNTDSARTYSGASTVNPGGLWHLLAESVTVKVNAAVVPALTVTLGDITLAAAGTTVEAGMGFTHTIVTLPIDTNFGLGSTLGSKSRIHKVILMLRSALGSSVNGDDILYRDSADLMDTVPAAYTGPYEVVPDTSWGRDNSITITGSQPYNFSINAIIVHGNYSAG